MSIERLLADPVALIAEALILPSGKAYGECWAPFQERFFRAIFAAKADGRPVHRLAYDERRRGESKTEDLAAIALADLLTGPEGHRSYAVAGDQDQAALILDSVRGFHYRSPVLADLRPQKDVIRNPATGSEFKVIASDVATSFGLRPRRIYFDELSLQPDEKLWTSMWTSIGKNPRSQMVAVSMAGWDFASLGWRIRELARESDRYYFHSREASALAPWLDERDMEEQRATLHPADFARYWECRWTEPKGSWITREMFEGCVTGQERSTAAESGSVGFCDVGLVHDATAVAVVSKDSEGRRVLNTLRTLQGSKTAPVEIAELENLVTDLTQQFAVRRWVFEAPQAAASVQRLQRELSCEVELRYPTVDTQARLFGGLYSLFASRRLVLYPHEQLRREALSLVTKTVGGRLKVVDSGAIHQDHVIALGGACDILAAEEQEGDVWVSFIDWEDGVYRSSRGDKTFAEVEPAPAKDPWRIGYDDDEEAA